MSAALVIPVPLEYAHAWARGWIGDLELLLCEPPGFTATGHGVYICTLPDLDAWRRVLPELVTEYRKGASCFILRTETPAVVHHIEKWGAVRTLQDPSGRWRWIAGPAIVQRYFGRIAQKSAARAGVTISR